jgi:hypothetical protein
VIREVLKTQFLFVSLLIAVGILIVLMGPCKGADTEETNAGQQQVSTKQHPNEPIIIWHYSAYRDTLKSLELAISSDLITHVNVSGLLHRKDRNYKKNDKVLKAVKLIKDDNLKLIWTRWLWPGYAVEQVKTEDLFNPDYYIGEIRKLKAEAEEVGADFVALDTEPYAHCPLKLYMKGKKRLRLTVRQSEQLENAIQQTIQKTGKIDFIYPAGSNRIRHPYNVIAKLGKNRVSEHTFYDNKKWLRNVKYPYEIFGAYLNTTKKNKRYPHLPFYLPREIFEKSHLWSEKKGVFLYPREKKALAVAKELVAYSRTLPYKNKNNPHRKPE